MFLPYKTRRFLRGLGTTVLVLALILVLAWVVWMLWLDRYIVYTRTGMIGIPDVAVFILHISIVTGTELDRKSVV